MPDIQSHPKSRRITLVIRLWLHADQPPVWIGEVQDARTGETVHVRGLEALFDLLKQKTNRTMQTPEEKK